MQVMLETDYPAKSGRIIGFQHLCQKRLNLTLMTVLWLSLDEPTKMGRTSTGALVGIGWLPLVPPPVTRVGTTRNWTQVCWVYVCRLNHWAGGTGVRGLTRGMATLPRVIQEPLVVRDWDGRPKRTPFRHTASVENFTTRQLLWSLTNSLLKIIKIDWTGS